MGNMIWNGEFPMITPDDEQLTFIINIAAAFGEPIIYCNKLFAHELMNKISYNNIDIEQVRDEGYIGKYKGTIVYITKTFPHDKPYAVIVPLFKYKEGEK